jgi:hypothetical protein
VAESSGEGNQPWVRAFGECLLCSALVLCMSFCPPYDLGIGNLNISVIDSLKELNWDVVTDPVGQSVPSAQQLFSNWLNARQVVGFKA